MQIKSRFTIRDWSGNYPFEANPHASYTALSGGPINTWETWGDAEEYLESYLKEGYDDLRGEYYIEEVLQ